jgi:hypothetical protein
MNGECAARGGLAFSNGKSQREIILKVISTGAHTGASGLAVSRRERSVRVCLFEGFNKGYYAPSRLLPHFGTTKTW